MDNLDYDIIKILMIILKYLSYSNMETGLMTLQPIRSRDKSVNKSILLMNIHYLLVNENLDNFILSKFKSKSEFLNKFRYK